MGRDRISEEIINAVDDVFPGIKALIEQKRMDRQVNPLTRQQEHDRRILLRRQAAEIQRLQLEACGQLVLPIFGSGTAKKLAQSEVAALPLKGMEIKHG